MNCALALVSLLQSCWSRTATLSTRDWSRVQLQTDNHIGTARDIFASLAGLCHKFENQLCAEGQWLLLYYTANHRTRRYNSWSQDDLG